MEELSEEQKRRRRFLKERLSERRGITPKKVMEEMPFCTVLIDDLDDFTEFMGADIERIAALMKEGIAAGITCIVTVHAGKSRGMSAMDKLVRQTANGLVLSAQGVVPVFPALSTRDLPKPGRECCLETARTGEYVFHCTTKMKLKKEIRIEQRN